MARTIYRLECGECSASIDNARRVPKGWTEVERIRSLRESRRVRARPGEWDFSLLDWNTHVGLCPECTAEAAKEEAA